MTDGYYEFLHSFNPGRMLYHWSHNFCLRNKQVVAQFATSYHVILSFHSLKHIAGPHHLEGSFNILMQTDRVSRNVTTQKPEISKGLSRGVSNFALIFWRQRDKRDFNDLLQE